jgi:hypothetical protein
MVRECGLTKKAEPPPTRSVNRDSGTDRAIGGWLQRLVRRRRHPLIFESAIRNVKNIHPQYNIESPAQIRLNQAPTNKPRTPQYNPTTNKVMKASPCSGSNPGLKWNTSNISAAQIKAAYPIHLSL